VKVVATYSIKGGVGKTTAAVNVAHEAARAGARVLIWDLDPQGAATYLFRVRPRVKGGADRLVGRKGELSSHVRGTDLSAVHVVPADFRLRHLDVALEGVAEPTERLASLLAPLSDRYDLAVLDCAPSISLVGEGVFHAADALLVPVIPATLASRTLRQLVGVLEELDDGPLLLPFLSMVDRRKGLHRELVVSLAEEWPQLLPTPIPNAAVLERMGLERAPVAVGAPSSAAAEAYRQLWTEVAGRLWPAPVAPELP
jgi:chromosome partitioning protein